MQNSIEYWTKGIAITIEKRLPNFASKHVKNKWHRIAFEHQAKRINQFKLI